MRLAALTEVRYCGDTYVEMFVLSMKKLFPKNEWKRRLICNQLIMTVSDGIYLVLDQLLCVHRK